MKLLVEFCAGRILRALRIAARLGLSLSREITSAIQTFYLLVKDLNKVLYLEYSHDVMLPKFGLEYLLYLMAFLVCFHAISILVPCRNLFIAIAILGKDKIVYCKKGKKERRSS